MLLERPITVMHWTKLTNGNFTQCNCATIFPLQGYVHKGQIICTPTTGLCPTRGRY